MSLTFFRFFKGDFLQGLVVLYSTRGVTKAIKKRRESLQCRERLVWLLCRDANRLE